MLIVSERLRKAMGIACMVLLFLGSFPPLVGTPVGVALIFISLFGSFPFFYVTYIDDDLKWPVLVTAIAGYIIGIPCLLIHLANKYQNTDWSPFIMMATLLYGGLSYLLMRSYHKYSKRKT